MATRNDFRVTTNSLRITADAVDSIRMSMDHQEQAEEGLKVSTVVPEDNPADKQNRARI